MTDDAVPDELDVAGQAVEYGDRAAIVRGSERITLPSGETHVRLWIDVDDPADVTDFEDLATPDWLKGASWSLALEMSDSAEEFAGNLGWGDPEDLQLMVEVLGHEDEFAGDLDE